MTDLTRRLLLAAAAASLASAAAAQDGAWAHRASMPWPAQEIYAAGWRGRVVVAGGLAARGGHFGAGFEVLDRTAIYDPVADRWVEGLPLPSPRHHPVLAGVEGLVLAFGGFEARDEGQWSAMRSVLAFDGDHWAPAGEMPGFQCEATALASGSRVHLLGGRAPRSEANARWDDHRDVDSHRVFDAAEGRWTTARPLAAARNSAAGAAIAGALYLVGGRTVEGGNLARLDRYDPEADRWDALRPMPRAAGGLAAAALGARLLTFGGEAFDGKARVIREAWVYDPGTDVWTEAAPLRTPRHGLAGVSVGGAILAIGGATLPGAAGTSAVVEAWRP